MNKIILILLILTFSTEIHAEPTKTPKYLMSESVSLLDWGIYTSQQRLESLIESLTNSSQLENSKYLSSSTEYDFDENRIDLKTVFIGKVTNENCKNVLKFLKAIFVNFEFDEAKQREAAELVLDSTFSHEAGYLNKKRPKDIGKQLVHITTIETTIFSESFENEVKCKSTFKSPEISIISK
ncbi:MAG: hypothetical protein N0E54_13700 [Candidatus Thiodiazotropha taylori]|nr:hypothetical protein [Candidatus Thiodiazotropha endolucinida]MCW4229787.1 hypothetical protein [Candidatus Thiodiazotropha taylori]